MDVNKLTNKLSIGPQIAPGDVEELRRQGFRSIIGNRPDGEGADQPSFAEIEAAAKKAGLETRHIPVETGKVSDEDAQKFGEAMRELPKPVLYLYQRDGSPRGTS